MSGWVEIINKQTPYSALDDVAASLSAGPIDDLRRELDADVSLTPAARAAAIAKATPLIVAKTRAALEAAWMDVHDGGGVLH